MSAKENIKKLIRKGIIGIAIGLIVVSSLGDRTFLSYALGVACFTGVPYGWELSGRVITFGVVGSLPIMIICCGWWWHCWLAGSLIPSR